MVVFLPTKWKEGNIYQEKGGKKKNEKKKKTDLAVYSFGIYCCKMAIEHGKLKQSPC